MSTPVPQHFDILTDAVAQLRLVPSEESRYSVEEIAYYAGVDFDSLIEAATHRFLTLAPSIGRPDYIWADGLLLGMVFQRRLLDDPTLTGSEHLSEIEKSIDELCGEGGREVDEVCAIAGINHEAVILVASIRGDWLSTEVNPPTIWIDGFLVGVTAHRHLVQNTPENVAYKGDK